MANQYMSSKMVAKEENMMSVKVDPLGKIITMTVSEALKFAKLKFGEDLIISKKLGDGEAAAYKSLRKKLENKGLRRRVFTREEAVNYKMMARRIKEGLLGAKREKIMNECVDEMLDRMQEDSKSEVLAVKSFPKPAVCAESSMAVKTMEAVVGELRREKRIKIGKKVFGE